MAKIFGIYRIEIEGQIPISIIIENNILGSNLQDIMSIYDLKGSTFGRYAERKNPLTVLKDQNFIKNPDDALEVKPTI